MAGNDGWRKYGSRENRGKKEREKGERSTILLGHPKFDSSPRPFNLIQLPIIRPSRTSHPRIVLAKKRSLDPYASRSRALNTIRRIVRRGSLPPSSSTELGECVSELFVIWLLLLLLLIRDRGGGERGSGSSRRERERDRRECWRGESGRRGGSARRGGKLRFVRLIRRSLFLPNSSRRIMNDH